MVDQERVCCMCGDVGFADKLFRCSRCRFRFQHLYCSNYYNGSLELSSSSSVSKSMEVCDWCQSEGNRNSSSTTSSKSYKRSSSSSSMDYHINNSNSNSNHRNLNIRSEHTSGERIKQHQDASSGERGTPKNNHSSGGVPSPRPSSHRRYKLLKDVMC